MDSLDIIKQHIIKTLTSYDLSEKNKFLRAELGKIHTLADKLSKNNGWISIDNPPPENQLVLLFDGSGEQTIGKIIKKCNAHRAHDYTLQHIDDEYIFELITTKDDYHYGIYHDIALISDFTHWQPLPQPPKE